MKVLRLENISFSYDGKRRILDDVCLSLEEGTVTALTGSSGCGKSTIAMIACGVIPKSVHGQLKGRVMLYDEDIAKKQIHETAKQISMVSQDPESQLFAPAVMDEVAFGPENLCFAPEKINKSVHNALAAVGMAQFADYSPDKLSGGQQQLIALASILSLGPNIIILDEVAAQVDAQGQELLQTTVKLLKKQKKTLLIIEHGSAFKALYDKAYVLRGSRLCDAGGGL